jgi:hypothetical protein
MTPEREIKKAGDILIDLSGDLSQFKLGKAPWGLLKLESRDVSARCSVNQLSVRKAWSNLIC